MKWLALWLSLVASGYAGYALDKHQTHRMQDECPTQDGKRVVSQTVRPNGEYTCVYIRDVQGWAIYERNGK